MTHAALEEERGHRVVVLTRQPRGTIVMTLDTKHLTFTGRMVIVGFGSIGQGVLPLILRHIGITKDQITIVTAEERGHGEADEFGVKFINLPLTRENYAQVLEPLLG